MPKLRSVVAVAAVLAAAILFAPGAQAAPVGQGFTVTAADLAYILKQIRIAEAHVANTTSATGPCGALAIGPAQPFGLRTVDGSCNHLGAGQATFGAADQAFPRLVPAQTRPAYTGRNATDAEPRLISNLIADQSVHNPAAVAAARGDDPANGIPNVTPDAGLSAPYNSWFTLFGQFFDHGVDQTVKGGGTVILPLAADDPLVISENLPASLRFMVLSRASAGNTVTPYADNSQTYTSHPAHQVFLREYDDRGRDTGRLLTGAAGGLPTWADVKRRSSGTLGLELTDADALNVPVVLADTYGNYVPGPARSLPQYVTSTGLVEGDTSAPVAVPSDVLRVGTPFLSDVAHAADPSRPGYDAGLLGRHYVAGDARVNENIGLTAIHQIFHFEHNRLVGDIRRIVGDSTDWTGTRIFQAARFIDEMEYQHLVFEEFARKIQPAIEPFAAYQQEINPAIYAEFAHAVYRFGHSMLTETIARTSIDSLPLLDGFLNPDAFTDGGTLGPEQAAGEIVTGMSGQAGNEIDEFVTDTLRNRLLGLPNDLAAINIARGRSEGVPPLNAFRRGVRLTPYLNWVDFGEHLRHPESLVNFIAAYGTDPSLRSATTVTAKRAAAQALMDSPDFLYAPAAESGLDDVDLWIGGLAEAAEPFGGLLGSTFDLVFTRQLTALQNGDRLYYLNRTPGMNLRSQLEGNSFAELIERNTSAQGLPADVFATTDCAYDLTRITYSGTRVLDDPASACDESAMLLRQPDGTIKQRGQATAQAVWIGGEDRDRISAGRDDDSVWGAEGDDILEGGTGDDAVTGGEGDDILTDSGGADMLRGGPGNDAIDAGPGADVALGGDDQDFVEAGTGADDVFGGEGDDVVSAGDGADTVLGDAGDDWEEGGDGPDVLQGDSGNPYVLDDANRPGPDVLIGQGGDDDYDLEGGDDIGVQGPGVDRYDGGSGYDWSIASENGQGGDDQPMDADLARLPVTGTAGETMDRYREVEALSGGPHDDTLRGDDLDPATGGRMGCDALDAAGIARIAGLDQVVTSLATPVTAVANNTGRDCDLHGNVWGAGNVLLGGPGDDTLQGRGGDDVIDGDRYLTVRLGARSAAGDEIRSVSSAEIETDVLAGKIKDLHPVRAIAVSSSRDVDTAVFSGTRSAYTIAQISGGVLVSGPDGVDTVRNVELLKFDDRTVDISTPPTTPTAPPTTTTPTTTPPTTAAPTTAAPATAAPTTAIPTTAAPGTAPTGTVPTRPAVPVAPEAPVIGHATAGDASAIVRWTAPGNDGGSPIYGYEVQVLDDETGIVVGVDATGPDATELTMTDLTNGRPYSFWIRAVNAAGASEFSTISNRVIPAATIPSPSPTPPSPGSGKPGTTPGLPTGSPTTSPTTPSTSPTSPSTSPTSPTTPPSTPTTPPVVRRATPSVPRALTVTPGPAEGVRTAALRWTAPAADGGAPITGYRLTIERLTSKGTPTGKPVVITFPASARTATFTAPRGMAAGTRYRFTLRAVNAVGAGPARVATGTVR
ncbi:peroxidase family protein [Actinoplanes sp. NPDC020271]|uniref:peroxidase family protein n=1 Tax=Actinoplanes sp. NPDC020271 TaxID=3363896 RepID=UPI00378EDBB4